jgi:hypothetical protein
MARKTRKHTPGSAKHPVRTPDGERWDPTTTDALGHRPSPPKEPELPETPPPPKK